MSHVGNTATSSIGVYYCSLVFIIFIYCTAPFTFIAVRRYALCLNFNEDFWRCRQPTYTICYLIAFLFVLYILNPVTLIFANVININSIIPIFVNDVADAFIFLMLFPRAWILWFDRAFYDNLKNWLWRRELNGQDGNFMVRHRAILKSTHILVYFFYLIFVGPIFSVLHVLPYFDILPFACDIIRTCVLVALLASTVRVVHEISVVFDEHHIRSEVLGTVKTSCVSYIFGHIFYVILEQTINTQWALLIELIFVCIADLCVIYWTCVYSRHKFEFIQKVRLVKTIKAHLVRRQSFTQLLSKRIQFQDIMDHRHGIESFCHHLQNEFGLESILFLLEVTQFKAVICKKSMAIEDNVAQLAEWHTTDVDEVTKRRVFSADSILDIHWLPIDPRMHTLDPFEIALHIYDKYVEEAADLCINISFGIRKSIYRYFQEVAIHKDTFTNDSNLDPFVKMYHVYDAAFTEVWRLIQTDSFLRFKGTDDFRRLAAVLFPEAAKEANQHLIQMVDEAMQMEQEAKQREHEMMHNHHASSHNPIEKAHEIMPSLPKININSIRPKLLSPTGSSKIHNARGLSMVVNNDFATALTSIEEEAPRTPILNEAGTNISNMKPIASWDSLALPTLNAAHRSLPGFAAAGYRTGNEIGANHNKTESDASKILKLQAFSRSLPSRGEKNMYNNGVQDSLPWNKTAINRLYSDSRSVNMDDLVNIAQLAVPSDSMSELKPGNDENV